MVDHPATAKDFDQDAELKKAVEHINKVCDDIAEIRSHFDDIAKSNEAVKASTDRLSARIGSVEQSAASLAPLAHVIDRLRGRT